MNELRFVLGLVAIVAAAPACSRSEEAPPPRAPTQRPEGARTRAAVAERTTAPEDEGQLAIDPEIARACGLDAAYFDFDSSAIAGPAAKVLDDLATCLTRGPLAGRALKLVGHADPRGETTYNFGLGQRRAGSVAEYLQARGMAADRIATSSRGEIDATGVDETSWQLDRRVEVLLGD
jgi:peptidoglycan-associated lipoprotein